MTPAVNGLQGVDHLVYAVPVLEEGVAAMESLLGVRPVAGGRHPHHGTHNALLSLGEATYLEIIAPDPHLPRPERGLVFGMDALVGPGLATWALRREDLQAAVDAVERVVAEGDPGAATLLGDIQAGARDRADGVRLEWRLTDPYAMPMGGMIPFLIAWGATPHPAGAAPGAGRLVGITIRHPEPSAVRRVLAALHIDVEVASGAVPGLWAHIETPAGVVDLAPASMAPQTTSRGTSDHPASDLDATGAGGETVGGSGDPEVTR